MNRRLLPFLAFLKVYLGASLAFPQILIAFPLAGAGMAEVEGEWKPVTSEELKMTSVTQAPGAPAVCLFSEVFTDDAAGREHHYVRIKVLTEAGRTQGDIEIPYAKGSFDIRELKARIVRMDGSIVDFSGTPMDKEIVHSRGFKIFAKTFALPDVQPGSILEYQYELDWDNRLLLSDRWVVSGDLFTVRASFARRPGRRGGLHWFGLRLPPGVSLSPGTDGLIHMELKNVVATAPEDFMPPEAETRPRVEFYYYFGQPKGTDVEKYWTQEAKAARETVDRYSSSGSGVERAVTETTGLHSSPEEQLRKLYEMVQALRNLDYDRSRTQQEEKREKLKPVENVEMVLKRGYGGRRQLDWLFLALVRQSGFEAWPLNLARRDGDSFFDPITMSSNDLPGSAVLARVVGRDYFLDPGTPLLPFGWLRWGETSVKALRLDGTNGGFLVTPDTAAADSAVERKGVLNLDETGSLGGIVTITYSGLEAFNRRFDARDLDEVARRRMLESELQQWIPATAEVQLKNQPEWLRSEPSLSAEFSIRIPNWATVTRLRLLCPVGIFSGGERGLFQSEHRIHDLYFHFPSETRDHISITLPPHFRVDALPVEQHRDLVFLTYKTLVENEANTLQISRRLTLGRISLPASVYAGVRAFYQSLRSADDSQAVLIPEVSPAPR